MFSQCSFHSGTVSDSAFAFLTHSPVNFLQVHAGNTHRASPFAIGHLKGIFYRSNVFCNVFTFPFFCERSIRAVLFLGLPYREQVRLSTWSPACMSISLRFYLAYVIVSAISIVHFHTGAWMHALFYSTNHQYGADIAPLPLIRSHMPTYVIEPTQQSAYSHGTRSVCKFW